MFRENIRKHVEENFGTCSGKTFGTLFREKHSQTCSGKTFGTSEYTSEHTSGHIHEKHPETCSEHVEKKNIRKHVP
jgi:hypothetical protein